MVESAGDLLKTAAKLSLRNGRWRFCLAGSLMIVAVCSVGLGLIPVFMNATDPEVSGLYNSHLDSI